MYRFILNIFLALVILTGCERLSSSGRISFRVKSVDTKGTVITTDNIATKYGSFVTDVWLADGYASDAAPDGHYVDNGKVVYDTDKWSLENETFWLNETGLCFWSWSPVSNDLGSIKRTVTGRTKTSAGTLQFSYSFPNPNGTGDAGNQKDLLFAFNYQKYSESDPRDYVDVNFYHALACVNFKIGTLKTGAEIKNISMSNIYSSAACKFRPTEVNSEDKFSWSSFSNPKTIGQNYSSNSQVAPDNSVDNFFMIPQTTRSDAQLLVTFSLDGSANVTLPVDFSNQVWLPGYYYTYKITVTSLETISIQCIVNDWIEKAEINLE